MAMSMVKSQKAFRRITNLLDLPPTKWPPWPTSISTQTRLSKARSDGERSSQPQEHHQWRGGGDCCSVCGRGGGDGGRRGGGGDVRRRGERAGAVRAVPAGRRGAAERAVLQQRAVAARDGGHGGGAARAVQVPGAVRAVVRRAPRPRAAAPGALQARPRHPRRRRHRLQQDILSGRDAAADAATWRDRVRRSVIEHA